MNPTWVVALPEAAPSRPKPATRAARAASWAAYGCDTCGGKCHCQGDYGARAGLQRGRGRGEPLPPSAPSSDTPVHGASPGSVICHGVSCRTMGSWCGEQQPSCAQVCPCRLRASRRCCELAPATQGLTWQPKQSQSFALRVFWFSARMTRPWGKASSFWNVSPARRPCTRPPPRAARRFRRSQPMNVASSDILSC